MSSIRLDMLTLTDRHAVMCILRPDSEGSNQKHFEDEIKLILNLVYISKPYDRQGITPIIVHRRPHGKKRV